MNLEQRLERLERQNRRLKMAGFIALLAVLSVVLMGQAETAETVPDVIKAKTFIAVDDEGNERVLMGSMTTGYGLALFDYDGRIRMKLLVEDTFPLPAIAIDSKNIEEYGRERFFRELRDIRQSMGTGFLFYDAKGEVIYFLGE